MATLCLWLSTATPELPTAKYYRTVIRDSYPGRSSIRAKATQEVSIALKLRHPPPENADHESGRGLARAAPPVRNTSMAAELQKKGSLM